MYIFGRELKSITLNPGSCLFFIAAIVLVANGTVSIWVVLLIVLADVKINIEIPIE